MGPSNWTMHWKSKLKTTTKAIIFGTTCWDVQWWLKENQQGSSCDGPQWFGLKPLTCYQVAAIVVINLGFKCNT